MRERAYPEYSVHMAEHRRLTAIASKLQSDFEAGRLTVTMETLTFLKGWLNDHILGMDQKYAAYYQKKAAQK